MSLKRLGTLLAVVVSVLVLPEAALAVPFAIGIGAFGAGSTLETFDSPPAGTEVNNLMLNGITYGYSLGDGFVRVVAGGPGDTNNVDQPAALEAGSGGDGTLTLQMSSGINRFGFGYAILAPPGTTVPNGTTISIYSGATFLGALSYTATPDPNFPGGFAGLENADAFDRVEIVFAAEALAFDVDNIRTEAAAAPEPSTLLLLGTGLALVALARRRG